MVGGARAEEEGEGERETTRLFPEEEGRSFSGQRYIDPFDPENSAIRKEQYTEALSPKDWAYLMGELERSLIQAPG